MQDKGKVKLGVFCFTVDRYDSHVLMEEEEVLWVVSGLSILIGPLSTCVEVILGNYPSIPNLE